RGREGTPRHARKTLPRVDRRRSAPRVEADVPVLQGRRQRRLRGRHQGAAPGRGRRAGAANRDPVRARLASVLQEIRRTLRGLGGQVGVSRFCGGGARAPRAADSRVPRAARPASGASGPARPPYACRNRRRPPGAAACGAASMIDLHTHTTASDGRCTPAELVARAQAAGVTVLGRTGHDTVAGCDAAGAACVAAGIGFVAGIEITAVREEADLHILGYFIDSSAPPLLAFLARQRQQRIERVRRMIAKLAELGIPLDPDNILRRAVAHPGVAIGRPWIARALVASGHVTTTSEAFSSWLGRGRPAFVAREGATAADVIAHIHDAGGIVSMAHPGVTGRDAWIPDLVAA